MSRSDVVIVGAGVIGCSIAYHLGKHGVRATVVERESIATRASGKAWAVIGYPPAALVDEDPGGSVAAIPDWHYLLTSSFERMPDLAFEIAERGGIDIEYGESLNIRLFTEEDLQKADRETRLAPYTQVGAVEMGWMDAAELREVFPLLSEQWVAGITQPQGQVEPYRYTLGLAQAAEKLGASFKQGEAAGFRTTGDRITGLELATGEVVEGDQFVIAAGPWTRSLVSHLGVDIPMRTLMAECFRVEVPGGLPPQTLIAGDYWIIPKVNGEVILGPYFGGVSDRPSFDASLTEELKLRTLTACAEILPALEDAKLLEHRGDLVAMPIEPPLDKPTMGRLSPWQNGYVATLFGPLGINMSPAAGELMAELVAKGHAPLRAARALASLAPPG